MPIGRGRLTGVSRAYFHLQQTRRNRFPGSVLAGCAVPVGTEFRSVGRRVEATRTAAKTAGASLSPGWERCPRGGDPPEAHRPGALLSKRTYAVPTQHCDQRANTHRIKVRHDKNLSNPTFLIDPS